MELRHLETFRVVAHELHFTRAALRLHYVQSSVTVQIQVLERELGVTLFHRVGKRVALTDAGRLLLPYAERLLNLAAETRAAVGNGTPSGVLTVGAPETLCTYRLPAILRRFRERYPQVRIAFRPGSATSLLQDVTTSVADVAFVLDVPLMSSLLHVEPLMSESVGLYAAPDHPLVASEAVNPADLASEPLLLTEDGCGYRALFLRVLATAGVHPTNTLELTSVEAIKQCAAVGMGIAVLPTVAVAAAVAAGELVPLLWDGVPLGVVTQMLWHRETWQSPALVAFIAETRTAFAIAATTLP